MRILPFGAASRAAVLLYAAAQFVVLTVVAMLLYPGGAKFDHHSDRYSFFQNFFSDLGATKTYSGRSNIPSHVVFIVAAVSVGLALILFAPTWKTVVAGRGRGQRLGIVAQILTVVAGLGFIGIAATPWDLVLDAHNAFVQLAFGFLLGYVLCLTVLQVRNKWPRSFVVLNAVYLVVLAAYVALLFAGPDLDTKGGLEFQVAAQKIIVYASIVMLGVQAYGVRRQAKRSPEAGMPLRSPVTTSP